jgi:hypothetical protein
MPVVQSDQKKPDHEMTPESSGNAGIRPCALQTGSILRPEQDSGQER